MSNTNTPTNTPPNSNNDVEKMTERATSIFSATLSFLTEMSLGDRISLKEMAAEIGTKIDMEPATVFPYVSDFARNNSLAYVSAGKFGGVIRGERKLQGVKSIKSLKTAPITETETTDEESNNDEE